MAKIAGFWLQLGIDGFRVDAVPFLIETEATGADGELSLDPHELLRDLRSFMSQRRGDPVLLGAVNLPPEGLVEFFGAGDELVPLFDFPLARQSAVEEKEGSVPVDHGGRRSLKKK